MPASRRDGAKTWGRCSYFRYCSQDSVGWDSPCVFASSIGTPTSVSCCPLCSSSSYVPAWMLPARPNSHTRSSAVLPMPLYFGAHVHRAACKSVDLVWTFLFVLQLCGCVWSCVHLCVWVQSFCKSEVKSLQPDLLISVFMRHCCRSWRDAQRFLLRSEVQMPDLVGLNAALHLSWSRYAFQAMSNSLIRFIEKGPHWIGGIGKIKGISSNPFYKASAASSAPQIPTSSRGGRSHELQGCAWNHRFDHFSQVVQAGAPNPGIQAQESKPRTPNPESNPGLQTQDCRARNSTTRAQKESKRTKHNK